MRTVRFGARGLLGLAFGALVATLPCGAAPATSGTVEDTGVEMRWGYQPASGARALKGFFYWKYLHPYHPSAPHP